MSSERRKAVESEGMPLQRAQPGDLFELLSWLRLRLEVLSGATSNEYMRYSLHALVRACDSETNPRLRRILEDLDLQPHSEDR